MIDDGIERGRAKQSDRDDILSRMAVSMVRTIDVNEKTGMKSCAGQVSISRDGRDAWMRNITFTSELTDKKKQQVVTVYGLN